MDLQEAIEREDSKINKLCGWETNDIAGYYSELQKYGLVEVGWRESCGATDKTHVAYRSWRKIITLMTKSGAVITEQRVKHGNAYASNKGGFWQSIIFRREG